MHLKKNNNSIVLICSTTNYLDFYCVWLCRPLITVVLQFLVGLLDRGALPGHNTKALLHLPQLVQVAVLGLALQRQLLLLWKERRQRGEKTTIGR